MRTSIIFFVLFFFLHLTGKAQSDSCNFNLKLNSRFSFNTSSLSCKSVWAERDFILRYKKTESDIWSFVLSTPNPNSYIAIGFSRNGKMVGSNAVVGWVPSDGIGIVEKYALNGETQSKVLPGEGELPVVNNSMSILSESSRLYLGFQLRIPQPLSILIYAVGPKGTFPGPSKRLVEHESEHSDNLDLTKGVKIGTDAEDEEDEEEEDEEEADIKTHGLLNMIGWGILLPIGIIMARYFKRWDPVWFYSHLVVQASGFGLGLAGVITGLKLEEADEVEKHKALGIVILVLGALQVMAVLGRPDKQSKIRKYWNWYHHTLGRSCIIIAIANIFYGIHLAQPGRVWNVGYGISLGVLVAVCVPLELCLWTRNEKP